MKISIQLEGKESKAKRLSFIIIRRRGIKNQIKIGGQKGKREIQKFRISTKMEGGEREG